jgi:hypothetical protein
MDEKIHSESTQAETHNTGSSIKLGITKESSDSVVIYMQESYETGKQGLYFTKSIHLTHRVVFSLEQGTRCLKARGI